MTLLRLLSISVLACLWCAGLLLIRFQWSGHTWFSFMVWNLFLAAIPLGFAVVLTRLERWRFAMPTITAWLLFFPNAPYVLTDLMHLKERGGMPLWFDLLMLLSFALVSLWMGFQSLNLVQIWIAKKTSPWLAWTFVGVSLLLSGFGIYLGRFLRWNSWDIIRRPEALLHDVWVRFADPFAHERTWGVTLGFGGLLMIAYLFWMFAASSSRDLRTHAD